VREVLVMTTDQTPTSALRFRIRDEADVLALVPYTFGFHPEDSLVMLTLDAEGRPFQARVDLPDEPGDLLLVSEQLIPPAVLNNGRDAILVAYTDDECLAEAATGLLGHGLEQAGIEVVLRLRADGARWFPVGTDEPDVRAIEGVPYDVRTHELTSRAVLDGRVTYRNRQELAGSLATGDWETAEQVSDAHAELPPLPLRDTKALAEEARRLAAVVRDAISEQRCPDPTATARLLRGIACRDVRDVVWCAITQESADAHVRLWRDVVRCCPEQLVAPAAGLLAFSAWLAGDGALAWCAVERSLCADPDHTLARLVGQALEGAVPPSTWQGVDPMSLPLQAG
jgi:hypothetical protein